MCVTGHPPLADNFNNNRCHISCKPPYISMHLMEMYKRMYSVYVYSTAQEERETKEHICNKNSVNSIMHRTGHKCQDTKTLEKMGIDPHAYEKYLWQYFIQHTLIDTYTVLLPRKGWSIPSM